MVLGVEKQYEQLVLGLNTGAYAQCLLAVSNIEHVCGVDQASKSLTLAVCQSMEHWFEVYPREYLKNHVWYLLEERFKVQSKYVRRALDMGLGLAVQSSHGEYVQELSALCERLARCVTQSAGHWKTRGTNTSNWNNISATQKAFLGCLYLAQALSNKGFDVKDHKEGLIVEALWQVMDFKKQKCTSFGTSVMGGEGELFVSSHTNEEEAKGSADFFGQLATFKEAKQIKNAMNSSTKNTQSKKVQIGL